MLSLGYYYLLFLQEFTLQLRFYSHKEGNLSAPPTAHCDYHSRTERLAGTVRSAACVA
jgi:hypothetical protein